jgi:serine protease inhibitor
MRSYLATLQQPDAGGVVVWDVTGTGWGYIRAGHQFLFIIQDRDEGNILFIQRVLIPNPNG